MDENMRFELFKRFYGVILTPTNVNQAVQYSQAAGCGGPGYPVFSETTSESREMERAAKRLAKQYNAEFEVVNQIGKEARWWNYSPFYKKCKSMKLGWKRYRYGLIKEPALVVIKGNENIVIYDCYELERKVMEFLR